MGREEAHIGMLIKLVSLLFWLIVVLSRVVHAKFCLVYFTVHQWSALVHRTSASFENDTHFRNYHYTM
jgi:hypothetical protein